MTSRALEQHLDRAIAMLQALVGEAVARAPAVLVRRHVPQAAQRQVRAEVVEGLGRHGPLFLGGFGEALRRLAAESTVTSGARGADLDSLGVMDDQRAQEEIEVAHAGRLLAAEAAFPLQRLLRAQAALQARPEPGPPRGADASPTGPGAIGRALWRATERLPLSLPARSQAVRLVAELVAPGLGPLYDQLAAEAARQLPARPLLGPPSPSGAGPEAGPGAPAAFGEPPEFDLTRPGALLQLVEPGLEDVPAAVDATRPLPLAGDTPRVPELIHRHRAALAALEPATHSAGPSAAVHDQPRRASPSL